MIDFEECLKQGLLRKIPASKQNALNSIEKAKELLNEAKTSQKNEQINSAVIVSYLSIFHAARALLFKEGYREKSHECIIRFIEEKYSKTGKIPRMTISMLDKYKSERTLTQYEITYSPNEEEAEKMLKFAEEFIREIEELI